MDEYDLVDWNQLSGGDVAHVRRTDQSRSRGLEQDRPLLVKMPIILER